MTTPSISATVKYLIPTRQIGVHHAFEELSVVGHYQVQQLVNNYDLSKFKRFIKQLCAK